MQSVTKELMKFWNELHDNTKEKVLVATPGKGIVNQFAPREYDIDASDTAKLTSIAFTVTTVISKHLQNVPKEVLEAISKSLVGAYGIGIQRGKGDVDAVGDLVPPVRCIYELWEQHVRDD